MKPLAGGAIFVEADQTLSTVNALTQNGKKPFAAMFFQPEVWTEEVGHWVIVEGASKGNNIRILDPRGAKYIMATDAFF